MPIRVKCPKCQKILTAKDHLAGKKVNCPVCKGPIVLPAPVADPVDMEDFAAAAFSEAPAGPKAVARAAPQPSGNIDFQCEYCDAQVRVPLEMAGKKTPCPECKRILTVPQPKKEQAKDWRQVETRGPAFAKRDEPAAPAGAWDTRASRVSTDALQEAGALPEIQDPPDRARWVKRGLWGAGALAVVIAAWVGISNYYASSAQQRALNKATEYLDPKPEWKTKPHPLLKAEVLRATGEFHAAQKNKAAEAKKAFHEARNAAAGITDPALTLERDLLLTHLALAQVALGTGDEVEANNNGGLLWENVNTELFQTLSKVSPGEGRAFGMRQVARKLAAAGQHKGAAGLARRLTSAPGEPPNSPLVAQQAALLLADNSRTAEQAAVEILTAAKDTGGPLGRLAYAEGFALQGKYAEARGLVAKAPDAQQRLLVSLAVASAALAADKADEARLSLEEGRKAEKELRGQKATVAPILLVELAQLLARAADGDAKGIADGIADKGGRAAAQLEVLEQELRGKRGAVEIKLVPETVSDKESLAYARALALVARHNARLGQRGDMMDEAERQEERHRAAMYAGVALGIQDSGK